MPDLESEEDVGYFDDFSSEDDMAKYKEVYEKQLELSKLADRGEPLTKSAFVGFTFRYPTPRCSFFEGEKLRCVDIQRGLWRRRRRGGEDSREDGRMGRLERCFERENVPRVGRKDVEPLWRLVMDVYAGCGMRYYILVVISCECILSIQIHASSQFNIHEIQTLRSRL